MKGRITILLWFGNYPNPFNPDRMGKTTISISTTNLHNLSALWRRLSQIKIYNIKGQLVKHLVILNPQSEINKIEWDGKDQNVKPVRPVIYFYHLIFSDKVIDTKPYVLVK